MKKNIPGSKASLSIELFKTVNRYNEDKCNGQSGENLAKIKDLLVQGADPLVIIASTYSSLSSAARQNLIPIMKLFKEHNVDINSKFLEITEIRDQGRVGFAASALHIAVIKNYSEMIELLISYNANLGCNEKSKFSPLHLALNKGANSSCEQIKLLVESMADINQEDYVFHEKASRWAIHTNDEIITYLRQCENKSVEEVQLTGEGI